MDPISRYPLAWPAGWRRIEARNRLEARFRNDHKRLTINNAVMRVFETLERMGVDAENDVVVSTNLLVRLDGLPRSGQAEPADPGACVYWETPKGDRRCMAIDRYDRAADNIAAIAATLEAMRAIERHGGGEVLDRAFTGFVALPAPLQWWRVFGYKTFEEVPSLEEVEYRYKRLARRRHPDREGGSEQAMSELNWARDEAREALDGDKIK